MRKNLFLYFLLLFPFWNMIAYGQPLICAPLKNGKVCYSDDVNMSNHSKDHLFEAINQWAIATYGSDIFFSNVTSNEGKGTITIRSKVELLLSETDKTYIKFKVSVQCYENRYTIDISDILYQYNSGDSKRSKTYPAEDIIANEGKTNKVSVIEDPLLFCNATHYFAGEIKEKVWNAARGESLP